MTHDYAAAEPHSLPRGGSGEQRDLGREVSEIRGELQALKWAFALAFVAVLGAMGFFYNALQTFQKGQEEIRQSLGAIYQQTVDLGERMGRMDERIGERLDRQDDRIHERLDLQDERLDRQGKRLDRQNERLDRMDGRLRGVEDGLVEVNGRLDQVDGRLRHVENGLVEVNGRLTNVEELLQVLVARSGGPP